MSCTPLYFNYQANELSKSLLLFSEPGTILRHDEENITYLKSYGAACFSNSLGKRSIAYKCNWVDKNKDAIINYEQNSSFVEKAKEKFLFLAFCIEYKRYQDFLFNENIPHFHTYLPIQLDATCNGFQHMAMLSDEEELFEKLNLKTNDKSETALSHKSEDEAQDFYSFVLHKLLEHFVYNLDKNIIEDPGTKGSYQRLNEFVWDRSYIKRIIMTIPYNASPLSMKKYFLNELCYIDRIDDVSWYSDRANSKTTINSYDASLLIKSISSIISKDYAKIDKLRKYLKNIAKLFNSFNMPITWNLPSGLIVNQSYLETESTIITPFAHSRTKLKLKTTNPHKYDYKKQTRALMPNLIHSLDGNSLCKLYSFFAMGYKDGVQFFSIHDCFATTCEKIGRLKHLLAAVYTDLYCKDHYLTKFDKDIFNLISNMSQLPIEDRTVTLPNGDKFIIHDIEWVVNKKTVPRNKIRKIDSQHILLYY